MITIQQMQSLLTTNVMIRINKCNDYHATDVMIFLRQMCKDYCTTQGMITVQQM